MFSPWLVGSLDAIGGPVFLMVSE